GGVARWQCGDRPGVDGEDDRGQEYCEYFAVSNGKRINRLSDAEKSKPLSCFFTSVYADVADGNSIDKKLATALSSKENLDAKFDVDLVRMHGGFNSRGAATTLIVDASQIGDEKGSEADKMHLRTASCFLASKKGDANKFKKACENKDLANDA